MCLWANCLIFLCLPFPQGHIYFIKSVWRFSEIVKLIASLMPSKHSGIVSYYRMPSSQFGKYIRALRMEQIAYCLHHFVHLFLTLWCLLTAHGFRDSQPDIFRMHSVLVCGSVTHWERGTALPKPLCTMNNKTSASLSRLSLSQKNYTLWVLQEFLLFKTQS